MARTRKHRNKFSEVLRRVRPYKRQHSRREMLEEFEEQYRLNNRQPLINL